VSRAKNRKKGDEEKKARGSPINWDKIVVKPSLFIKRSYGTTLFVWSDLSASSKNSGAGIEILIFHHSSNG